MNPQALKSFILHRMAVSGHCHRVQLMLSLLGLPYETVDLDLPGGAQRRPEFLALNPLGQVPVLQDPNAEAEEDGGLLSLVDSNAILVYLAQRYAPAWWPASPLAQARLQRWFSLAAGLLDFGVAAARFAAITGREPSPESLARGGRLLDFMQAELGDGRRWLLGGEAPGLADVALYSYCSQAHLAGLLQTRQAPLRDWLARVEALPGFIPLPDRL